MNRVKVIMSCDDNPYYSDFWNIVSHVWKNIIGIEPILIYISDKESLELCENNGKVIKIKKLNNVPIHLQAQLARIYYASEYPEDICIMSDIDILPLSREWFDTDQIKENLKGFDFYHLNPESREFGQLPMCYYSGYGMGYKNIIKNFSWEQFCLDVIKKDFNVDRLGYNLPNHLKDNKLWFSDELYLYTSIRENNLKINVKKSTISQNARIDRGSCLNIDLKNIPQRYIDFHMPRPMKMNEKVIHSILFATEIYYEIL